MMIIKFTREILGNHSDDEIRSLLLLCLCVDVSLGSSAGFQRWSTLHVDAALFFRRPAA
jgi:hypothetical protein